MAASKSKLIVGLVAIPVRLEKATDDESSGAKTVCIGTDDKPHDPTVVKQTVGCPAPNCGIVHTSVWGYPNRGVEQDGKMVLLTSEEIAGSAGAPIKDMELKFHPREKVYAATVAADSVQNVTPDKGGEKAYVALRNVLVKQPDVVAVAVWAPKSKNALWVLEVVGDRIVASKRCWPETVRVAPAIPLADVTEMEQSMFDMLVVSSIEDFDLGIYVDQATANLKALVDERAGGAVPMAAPTASAAPSSGDMLAALQASLDAAPKPAPKPVKKAPAKKAVAKKAPAKKTAAKKAAGRSAA